jgi:hypothetical protein
MSSTDFSRTPATDAPGTIKRYLDPSEELVFHRLFHWAIMLEPIVVVVLGLVVTSFADLAVRSSATAGRGRAAIVVVWVVWLAWALSTVWDYKTLIGFYKGSAVTRLFAFVSTLAVLALAGYIGKTRGVGAVLWYVFFAFCLWAALQIVRYFSRYMVLTQKRLIVVEGIVNKQIKSLPLPKLTDMIYQRTALGHALGYGTFDLQAPGAAVNIGLLSYVRDPDNTYLQISHLLWGGNGGPPPPKKIALSGTLGEQARPGEAQPGGPRSITITGEMDG